MQLSLILGQAMLLSSACAAPMNHVGSGRFLGPRRLPLYAGSNVAFSNETLVKRQLPPYTGTPVGSVASQTTPLEERRLPEYPGVNINGSQAPAQKRDGQTQLLTKRRAAEYPGSNFFEKKAKEGWNEAREPFWPQKYEDNKKEWQYEEKDYKEETLKEKNHKGQDYWKKGHDTEDSYKEEYYKEKETFEQEDYKKQEAFKEKGHADKKEGHDYCGCDCNGPNPKYVPQLPKGFWSFEYDNEEKW